MHTWYNADVAGFSIEIEGDLAGILTLGKQINFAASKSINSVIERSQDKIIEELDDEFVVRGVWYRPGNRFGINARFAKPSKLEGQVGTNADWLLEAHGANRGIKKNEGGRSYVDEDGTSRTASNLAQPDPEHVRRGIRNPVPRGQKAYKLLANAKRSKAFKVKSRTGAELILQRVGLDADGGILQNKRGQYLRGRGKKRPSKIVLKYILRKQSRVPYQPVVTRWGVIQFRLHHDSLFRQYLRTAIATAKVSTRK